jgi:transcriptional/translational regulatory protein YebC/TACO1
VVDKAKAQEDTLMSAALDAGADDMKDEGDVWEVTCSPENLQAVLDAVKALGLEPDRSEVAMLPQNYVTIEGKAVAQMMKLMEALDECDDTRNVWTNADFEEKDIEASLA